MYHITPEGKVKKCNAGTRPCPYGAVPHYATKSQAKLYLRQHMNAQYGGVPQENNSDKGFFGTLVDSVKEGWQDGMNPKGPPPDVWSPKQYVAPVHNPPPTGLPPGFTRHPLREDDEE